MEMSVGSVLGIVLGGVLASRFGWQAAFGVVGIPGLVIALFYFFVRDYETVETRSATPGAAPTRCELLGSIFRSRTVRWACIGGAAQLISMSALWSWLPSFLNRTYGIAPDEAGIQAALVVLIGALGSFLLGVVADRAHLRKAGGKCLVVAILSLLSMVTLMFAFGAGHVGIELRQTGQFGAILLGGFLGTCTAGPAAAIVQNVIHPGVRSTGAAVLALFQNLFGLASGPFIGGLLSDAIGLTDTLALTPLTSILAATAFLMARNGYQAERQHDDRARGSAGTTVSLGTNLRRSRGCVGGGERTIRRIRRAACPTTRSNPRIARMRREGMPGAPCSALARISQQINKLASNHKHRKG